MLVEVLSWCDDLPAFSTWLKENKPDLVIVNDDESVSIRKDKLLKLKTWSNNNTSFSVIRCDIAELHDGSEEVAAGWIYESPLRVMAYGEIGTSTCPYLQLLDSDWDLIYSVYDRNYIDDDGQPALKSPIPGTFSGHINT